MTFDQFLKLFDGCAGCGALYLAWQMRGAVTAIKQMTTLHENRITLVEGRVSLLEKR